MIPQTESVLKSYFQTGDIPTQAQFEEFIGTMFYLYNAIVTASAAAQAAAEAAEDIVTARGPQAYGRIARNTSVWTVRREYGCTITWGGASNNTITLTFDTALPDAHYLVYPLIEDTELVEVVSIVRNTGSVVVTLNGTSATAKVSFLVLS